ncbi:UMP-CMP kinase 2-like [Ischnura elegans]|uniref:UMP-CMP kinase 2-like n=1 Tax=Ischnura elegans TaxID=197161 RepID=UPI001ED87FE6|nr:UMP-CMP kinase 2-like [Ischnura elegans]
MLSFRRFYRSFAVLSRTTYLDEMKNVVFVLGPPGSGKGTQCEKIVNHFGYIHLSAGDLLRKEWAKQNSKYHDTLEHCFRNVKVVPSEITFRLLMEAMVNADSHNFLIDAFPMNDDNLKYWNKEVSNDVNLQFVLYFDCPQEVCVERCLSRGTAASKRIDDNTEALKKRFDTYINDTLPIIEHYKSHHLLRTILANRCPDDVFNDLKKEFHRKEGS